MKSRHLSIVDYLEQLQKEYITAEIKYRVARTESDRLYHKTIMDHKKVKIVDIAERNKIKSIFNDDTVKHVMWDSVLVFGFPKYEYRDFYQKKRLEDKDKTNYFDQNSDVKINIGTEILLGKIKYVDFKNNVATCIIRGSNEEKFISLDNIKRVL